MLPLLMFITLGLRAFCMGLPPVPIGCFVMKAPTWTLPLPLSMPFASEEPELFDEALELEVKNMIEDAIDCEYRFGEDVLTGGIAGFSLVKLKLYLQFVADQRLARLSFKPIYRVNNPFSFMELQNVQELANFFERRVSAYQIGVSGEVAFDQQF